MSAMPGMFEPSLSTSDWQRCCTLIMMMVVIVMVMVMIVILADDGEGGNLNSDSLYALQHHLLQPEAATRCVRAPERVLMKITILIIV